VDVVGRISLGKTGCSGRGCISSGVSWGNADSAVGVPFLAPAVFFSVWDWVTKHLIAALSLLAGGDILSKTEHVINFTFVGDGSIENIISNRALALILCVSVDRGGRGARGAKSLNKLGCVVDDLSNLSHNSLVEVNLIEHGMELGGHTGWGTEHTKDSIEVLVINWISGVRSNIVLAHHIYWECW